MSDIVPRVFLHYGQTRPTKPRLNPVNQHHARKEKDGVCGHYRDIPIFRGFDASWRGLQPFERHIALSSILS